MGAPPATHSPAAPPAIRDRRLRVGLARVSTNKAEQDTSIEGQVRQLQAAGCDPVLAERASAYQELITLQGPAASVRRTAWQELWRLVDSGAVAEVMVVDQSRLSRSLDDLAFLSLCATRGTAVRDLRGARIEVETVGGFVQAGVVSVLNRANSMLMSMKTRDGIQRRREAGLLATGKAPFGYRVIEGRAAVDPLTWHRARARFEALQANGWCFTAYVREYPDDRCTRPGLRKWINHPMLRGFAGGQWGQVEALITWQEWAAACRVLDSRLPMRGRNAQRVSLFSCLVTCSSCQRRLVYHRRRARPERLMCHTIGCDFMGRSIAAALVRNQVIDAMRAGAAERMAELVTSAAPTEPAELTQLRAQLAQVQGLAAQGVPGLAPAIAQLQGQILALEAAPASAAGREEALRLLTTPGTLEGATDEELRAIVLEFVERISYLGNPRNVTVLLR